MHTLSTGSPGHRFERGVKIVDMTAVLGVLAAAAALSAAPPTLDPQDLPNLPARGFALEVRGGVELQTMHGRHSVLRTRRFSSYWMWGG